MAPTLEILFAGWRGPLPRCSYGSPRLIPLGAVTASFLRSRLRVVLVLGGEALRQLRPAFLRRHTRFPSCIVLAVPQGISVELIAFWVRSGVVEPVSAELLDARLREAVRIARRPELALRAWISANPKGVRKMRRLLEIIPSLLDLTVENWARVAGLCPRTLLRLCGRHLACSAKGVLIAYRDAVVARERRESVAMRTLVDNVGFANESNLRRSFRRRGLLFPTGAESPRRAS